MNLAIDALSEHTVTVRRVGDARAAERAGEEHGRGAAVGDRVRVRWQVDGLVDRIRDEVDGFGGDDVRVVGTGYLAPLMVDECETITDHHSFLNLDGLRRVYERVKARLVPRAPPTKSPAPRNRCGTYQSDYCQSAHGMVSTWPTLIRSGFAMLLSLAISG